jgi:hypothetical protein
MNKVKSLYWFFDNVTVDKKILLVFTIVQSLLGYPAFAFHEVMHMLTCFVLGVPFQVRKFYYLRVNRKKGAFRAGELSITHFGSSHETWLISLMPFIGWLFLISTMVILGKWKVVCYMVMFFRTFFLSTQDVKTLEKNEFPPKICNAFYYIQGVLNKLDPNDGLRKLLNLIFKNQTS